ncbi:MAG: DNA polymerase III subunit delta [Burkholderiales bacterium]|nr:DNA polymerase III subunit delta [Burkholderiales bacterium]
MQLRATELDAHLARTLAPLYVVHGDEPLLSLEAADAIRARARAAGHSERVVLAAERGFDWGALGAAAASLSLFGDRRIVELRIPSGKPGTDGAAAIQAYCARPPGDTVTIVSLPRLDKAGQGSAWFGALGAAGVVVNVFPVERSRLPEWIAARLARQKQRAAQEALDFIADSVEGNLLAAHQEIQKLALLYPPGELSFDDVREAVLDVARYDVAQLSEAMLAGDRVRLARILASLEGEGEAPPRVLWVMSEDVRAAARLQRAGARPAAELFRELRIWNEARQRLLARAAKRLSPAAVADALEHCARIDRMAKGLAKGDVWDELLALGLRFA